MRRQIKSILFAGLAAATMVAVTPALAENAADAKRDSPFSVQQDASSGGTAIAQGEKSTRGSDLVKLLEPNGPLAQ